MSGIPRIDFNCLYPLVESSVSKEKVYFHYITIKREGYLLAQRPRKFIFYISTIILG